jgi:uncharacterized protein (TIGR03435 family)
MSPTLKSASNRSWSTAFVATGVFSVSVAAVIQRQIVGHGLQAVEAPPTFEVASVRPNNSGERNITFTYQGGRFNATNVTLRMLIRHSYGIQDSQIVGGPSWVNSDRFNIIAKGDVGQSPAFPVQLAEGPSRLQLMMQALLAERFKLVVRKESKESNVYALIPARSDGRLGPALRRSDVDCAALAAAARAAASSALPVQPEQARATRCRLSRGLGAIAIDGRPLVQLASSLSNIVGRRVVDRTGLSGNFDVDLTWTPDQMPPSFPRSDEPTTASSDGPSIFTAIREQLGLKLLAQTRPDDVLAIERAERPALN